ncbi:MAG: methionine gamma-lyase family protein [Tissierellales bacterium]|nr:methionine gamma-lyase family protein [Tissierellales bacterium]
MLNELQNQLEKFFKVDKIVINIINEIEKNLLPKFDAIEEIKTYNQFKVLHAMQNCKLGSGDFGWNTGYGYGDVGREKVERIYADIFKAESALVRPSIASGTHAISLVFSGILRPGDELLYITGSPYDTMQKVIGIKGNEPGNLREFKIGYNQVDLVNGHIDIENTLKQINHNTKIVAIQRSTGYSDRNAISITEMKYAISEIKKTNPEILLFIDNCYGEFTQTKEPIEIGADIVAGSLIKNPGGGIAVSGGYIVGDKRYIDTIANRLTAPGLGKDCGLTFGTNRNTLQGLFYAPYVVAEALKGAILMGEVYHKLGFETTPSINDERNDIVQAIKFDDPKKVIEFCKGIQESGAVDSYVTPEAWDMPGYENKVIMASAGFIEGSSIEISADAPLREPYYVYYQGGTNYAQCKLAVIKTVDNLYKKNLIDINKVQVR